MQRRSSIEPDKPDSMSQDWSFNFHCFSPHIWSFNQLYSFYCLFLLHNETCQFMRLNEKLTSQLSIQWKILLPTDACFSLHVGWTNQRNEHIYLFTPVCVCMCQCRCWTTHGQCCAHLNKGWSLKFPCTPVQILSICTDTNTRADTHRDKST